MLQGEAGNRLAAGGHNELKAAPRLSPWALLFAVLLGFVQEYRAERALEALRQMAAPTATIM